MPSMQKSESSELLALRLFLAAVILISFGMVAFVAGYLGAAINN